MTLNSRVREFTQLAGNTGGTIFRQNDILFDYLNVFYIAYLDDILIYSKNILEHKEHVKKVL